MRVNAYIEVAEEGVLRCRCGHLLGPASGSYKRVSLEARRPVQDAGPCSNPYGLGQGRFELREYSCPSCLVLYEAEIALADDPVLDDVVLDS